MTRQQTLPSNSNKQPITEMSMSYFFKHLVYSSLSRSSIHLSPPSLSLLSRCKFLPPLDPSCSLFFSYIPISHCSSSVPASHDSTTTEASPYLSVRIRCPKHAADILSEALLSFGATSTSMDADADFESSNEICVDSIFPQCEDVDVCVSRAADSIGLKETPAYDVKIEEQHDWIRETQESFVPVEIVDGLWIVPEWISPPDAHSTNIIINPGLAFGTGEHPTTKLCLLLLQGLIRGGELFLDYGTGSGILAIAALKFGATRSVGFDIDPEAVKSASYNAALNNIGPEEIELRLVPETSCSSMIDDKKDEVVKDGSTYKRGVNPETEKYDVVIANILLNPLTELADHIVSFAKPGAVVGLSGILCEQSSSIVDRYSALLEDISVSEIDGWAFVSGRKKQ